MPRKKASTSAPTTPPGLPEPEAGKVWLKVSSTVSLAPVVPVEPAPLPLDAPTE